MGNFLNRKILEIGHRAHAIIKVHPHTPHGRLVHVLDEWNLAGQGAEAIDGHDVSDRPFRILLMTDIEQQEVKGL